MTRSFPQRFERVTVALTLLLIVGPVLVDLAHGGARRAFGYVAADSFYYLTIARNVVEHGVVSFDQIRPTNSFHPLWQLVTVGVVALMGVEWGVLGVVLVGTSMIGGGFLLLVRAWRTPVGPGVLTLPVGAFGLLLSPLWWAALGNLPHHGHTSGSFPLFGTTWSFANGMESSAVILVFAVAAYLWTRRPPLESERSAIAFGASLAALGLARLDHTVFGVALVTAVALRSRGSATRARRAGLLALAFVVPIALYLLASRVAFGAAFPLSGSLKTSFPQPDWSNLQMTLGLMFDPPSAWLAFAWREANQILPAGIGVAHMVSGRLTDLSREGDRFDGLLRSCAPAVVVLGAYNFFFVNVWSQGHWYFPLSSLWVSLVAARAIDRRFGNLFASARAYGAWALGWSALAVFYFLTLHRQLDYQARFAQFFYEEGPRVRAHYGEKPPRLLSFDDGIVAYTTGFPTMSGTGNALDVDAYVARREHRLLRLSVERGHDHVTTLAYPDSWTSFLGGEAAGQYRVALDYVADDRSFFIVRFSPKH